MIVDGLAVNSCLYLAVWADGRSIRTAEGEAKLGQLSEVQQAYLDTGAVQCGFCTPGMLISARALLNRCPNPSEEQVREALVGNLCRCTGYTRIVAAVRKAGGVLVVSADHGNSDDMYERDKKTGEVIVDPEGNKIKTKTAHSLNPVPVHIYAPGAKAALRLNPEPDLGISSLAATCLTLLGFEPPHDYTPSIVVLED